MPVARKRFRSRRGGVSSKRRFSKRFSKYRSPAAFRNTKFSSTALNNRTTFINFKISRFTKMPFPDRYLCWLNIENQGSNGGAGSNTFTFGVALNDPVVPFSKSGPIAVSLVNPVQSIATWDPAGLRNILFNSTTGTGIYTQFRVWTTIVRVTFTPGNAADSVNGAIVPLAQSSNAYTTFESICQAPNSVTWTSTFGSYGEASTGTAVYGIPALYGVPNKLYPAVS